MEEERADHRITGRPTGYRIRVAGRLDESWMAWFGSAEVSPAGKGETAITCREMDQAALHGLLRRIRDLGLPLIAVCRIVSDEEISGQGGVPGEEEVERED